MESGDGKLTWSPIKLSRSCVRAASDFEFNGGSSDVELKPPEIASTSFEERCDVSGFELETHDDDAFWIPVAYRT